LRAPATAHPRRRATNPNPKPAVTGGGRDPEEDSVKLDQSSDDDDFSASDDSD